VTIVVDLAIMLYLIHAYRAFMESKKLSKIAPDPGSVLLPAVTPLTKETNKFIEDLVAEMRDQGTKSVVLETVMALGRQLQETLALHAEGAGLEQRYQALCDVCDIIEGIAALTRHSDGKDDKILTVLRQAADEEWEKMRLIQRNMYIACSTAYTCGTLGNRVALVQKLLPAGPNFYLVHYQALDELGHVPAPIRMKDGHYVMTARDAYKLHGSNAVVFSAINPCFHEPDDDDLAALVARQLVTFAKGYRQKWGRNLEIYYWIDVSCLPATNAAWTIYSRNIGLPLPDEDDSISRSSSKSTVGALVSFPSKAANGSKSYAGSAAVSAFGSSAAGTIDTGFEPVQPHSFLTEAAIESLLPLIYAACDGVVICDAEGIRERAWTRVQLGLAYSLSQASPIVYEVDSSFLEESVETALFKKITKSQPTAVTSMPTPKAITSILRAPDEGEEDEALALALALEDGSDAAPATPDAQAARPKPAQLQSPEEAREHPDSSPQASTLALMPSAAERSPQSPHSKMLASSTPKSAMTDMTLATDASMVSASVVPGIKTQMRYFPDVLANPAHVNGFKAPSKIHDTDNEHAIVDKEEEKKGKPFQGASEEVTQLKGLMQQRTDAVLASLPAAHRTDQAVELLKKIGNGKKGSAPAHDTAALVQIAAVKAQRVARLSTCCKVPPQLRLYFDPYFTKPLAYDTEGMIRVHRLEHRRMKQRIPIPSEADSESSSDSEDEASKPHHKIDHVEHLHAEDHMMELYYGNKIHDTMKNPSDTDSRATRSDWDVASSAQQSWNHTRESFNARTGTSEAGSATSTVSKRYEKMEDGGKLLRAAAAAGAARLGTGIDLLPSLKPGKSPLKFHTTCHSPNVRLPGKPGGETIEQFHVSAGSKVKAANKMNMPNGGMILTSRALSPQVGVMPDDFLARGVIFQITVERTDPQWEEGMAIGFTTQSPDTWPAGKELPRSGFLFPKTWICGYGGTWHLQGKIEEAIVPSRRSLGAWRAKTVKPGDVITAVAAGEPTNLLRVFVNDKLVTEQKLGDGCPDFSSKPVWGILDTGGTCLIARMGGVPKRQMAQQRVGPAGAPGDNSAKGESDIPALGPLFSKPGSS